MSGCVAEAESAELALYRLEEIDELLATVNEDEDDSQAATLAQYLRSGQDLESAWSLHNKQLRGLRDTFIHAHVQAAEQIAQLYHEFSACEENIVGFEEEMLTFQRKLEVSANDIVYMQQQADGLVRRVNNRHQVSNKINEVYSALQKCDSFCDVISTKNVDANYLANLRELDRRLAFLSGNKAVRFSAVDNEIRPKLTAAAHKAGGKLQRFLTKEIVALTEAPSRTVERQQSLEESAQFAFRFLQLYNQPVAMEITKLYIRYMSEFYVKQFRLLIAQFSELSAVHASPLEPLVSVEEARDIMSNRDIGAPPGNHVTPPPMNFPDVMLPRRERSVSQHMRGFADLIPSGVAVSRAEALHLLRPATFDDSVKAVNALGVRHGKLHIDDDVAAQLNECNSWAWQFVRCLQALVNTVESECRFIGNFFCVVGNVEGGEDFTSAERIACAVLGRAVGNVEASMMEVLPLVTERTEVLATLRVLEAVKQYLCTLLDPIPLLLLSVVLERSKTALRASLRTAVKNDELVLAFLPTLQLSPLHSTTTTNCSWTDLLSNKSHCAVLGPHPLIYRICGVLGHLEYLNTAAVRSSTLAGGDLRAFDASVATFVKNSLTHMMKFVDQLKHRYPTQLAQQVFACTNVYTILATWRELISLNGDSASGSPTRFHPVFTGPINYESKSGCSHFHPISPERPTMSTRGVLALGGDAGAGAGSQHMPYLEGELHHAIRDWAHAELANGESSWKHLLVFIGKATEVLGESFFDSTSQMSSTTHHENVATETSHFDPPARPSALPEELSESATLKVAAQLHSQWQSHASAIVEVVRKVVQQSLGRTVSSGDAAAGCPVVPAAVLQRQCHELSTLMLSALFSTLADANRKLAFFVGQYYSGYRELQSKVLNNTMVLHELSRLLESSP
ncbi:hypothetical protein JKF63_01834 [Porcisia hertigi]|uniref:Vps52 coiled-coil domain-containing protein n=1 Tax=Porcisia hertigi TaxID=2761500 RepID=A0A836L0G3_9TRYP|nr:hypothetical protein JKF63_01834 [Porcisia hertigi]